jgi:hypothetical protein
LDGCQAAFEVNVEINWDNVLAMMDERGGRGRAEATPGFGIREP